MTDTWKLWVLLIFRVWQGSAIIGCGRFFSFHKYINNYFLLLLHFMSWLLSIVAFIFVRISTITTWLFCRKYNLNFSIIFHNMFFFASSLCMHSPIIFQCSHTLWSTGLQGVYNSNDILKIVLTFLSYFNTISGSKEKNLIEKWHLSFTSLIVKQNQINKPQNFKIVLFIEQLTKKCILKINPPNKW